MMNFPGVLSEDPDVMAKIRYALEAGKPVDGHAPGLRGNRAKKYIAAGISTDHECFTYEEGLEKIQLGMKVLIREGSAAKNFEALIDLLRDHPEHIMFCSDDKHPDSLLAGHINQLCARAVAKQIDLFKVLRAACINPVEHYKLNVGLLREGDPADFIVVEDLLHFKVSQTFIAGQLVAENGKSFIRSQAISPINNFNLDVISKKDITLLSSAYPKNDKGGFLLIEALDGQLITNKTSFEADEKLKYLVSDPGRDILKMVVVNRYNPAPPSIAFIKNFGLKSGAIASSVAHDSHNIVAVGVDDDQISAAINLIIDMQGGISCVNGNKKQVLPLPVAGLMSDANGYEVAEAYTTIDQMAKEMGSTLSAPFMTLSFMALLVIPHLKLSDKGIFDGDDFRLLSQVQEKRVENF
jgi:adenine deaminase